MVVATNQASIIALWAFEWVRLCVCVCCLYIYVCVLFVYVCVCVWLCVSVSFGPSVIIDIFIKFCCSLFASVSATFADAVYAILYRPMFKCLVCFRQDGVV